MNQDLISGYKTLALAKEKIKVGMFQSQKHVADQLAVSLAGLKAEICTGVEALQTLKALVEIRKIL